MLWHPFSDTCTDHNTSCHTLLTGIPGYATIFIWVDTVGRRWAWGKARQTAQKGRWWAPDRCVSCVAQARQTSGQIN